MHSAICRTEVCLLVLAVAMCVASSMLITGMHNTAGSMIFGILVGGLRGVVTRTYRKTIGASTIGALLANLVVFAVYAPHPCFLMPHWSIPGAFAGSCAIPRKTHGMLWYFGASVLGALVPIIAYIVGAPVLAGNEIHVGFDVDDIQLMAVYFVVSVTIGLAAYLLDYCVT